MGWVDSLKYFCTISETLIDVANVLAHKLLPVPTYRAIAAIPETIPVPPYTLDSLTQMYFYMDNVITTVLGGAEQQREVFYGMVGALK